MHWSWRGLLMATLCLAAPAEVGSQSTTGPSHIVTLDARSGHARATQTLPTRSRVVVRLVNKNPFLYRYRVSANATTVQEPAIAAFLSPLNPVFAAALKAGASRTGGETRPTVSTTECPAVQNALEVIANEATRVEDELAWLDTPLLAHAAVHGTYAATRRQLADPWVEANALETTARMLSHAIDTYVTSEHGPAELDLAIDRLPQTQAAALVLVRQTGETEVLARPCPNAEAITLYLARVRARMRDVADDIAPRTMARLEAARSDVVLLRAASHEMTRVLEDPNAFSQDHRMPEYEHPTTLAIAVDRWPLDDKDEKSKETVARTTVLLGGGPRFVLSGGLAYVHGVATREYQPVLGHARDAAGQIVDASTMTTIVGIREDSPHTLAPMLLLNIRAWRAVHAAVGTTARKDSDGVHLDYFLGGSVAVLDDRLFLSLGWYRGRESVLAGDLHLGAKIPDDLGSVPTAVAYRNGVAALVTFKIK